MGATDAPLAPLVDAARPSRLMLRVSIAFALLSACGGWMLSGAGISTVFRAAKAPWKKASVKQVSCCCVHYKRRVLGLPVSSLGERLQYRDIQRRVAGTSLYTT